jgi:hypothetical protein
MALHVQGKFKNLGNSVNFNLPIITFTEDNIFFYYSPALDLTGYGSTDDEARESFKEVLQQFLDYSTNKKTFLSELKKLGWKISKHISKPPSLVEMINSNDYLAQIFEEKQYKKFHQPIDIPVFA